MSRYTNNKSRRFWKRCRRAINPAEILEYARESRVWETEDSKIRVDARRSRDAVDSGEVARRKQNNKQAGRDIFTRGFAMYQRRLLCNLVAKTTPQSSCKDRSAILLRRLLLRNTLAEFVLANNSANLIQRFSPERVIAPRM